MSEFSFALARKLFFPKPTQILFGGDTEWAEHV